MTKNQFWDRYLRAYDGLNLNKDYRTYLDRLASMACTYSGEFILDAGSGTGNLSLRMRRLGGSVVSLDSSPVGLAIHREKDPSATLVLASLDVPLLLIPIANCAISHVSVSGKLFEYTQGVA